MGSASVCSGVDLDAISTRVLLQKILGIANPESSSLFNGLTIRENLLYGVWKKEASPATGEEKQARVSTAHEDGEEKKEASTAGQGKQVSLAPFSRSMTACFQERLFKEVCQLCNIGGILANLTPAHEDTKIEGSLSPFSSGEQQRLGLARALIKQPKILVLDEATAHLDSHNERHLLQSLRYLLRNKSPRHSDGEGRSSGNSPAPAAQDDKRDPSPGSGRHSALLENTVHTILVIAHSKEALRVADNIIVFKQGQIVETGAYEDLIQRENGELTRLLKKQQH